MKLKLETEGEITILTVTEIVEPKHFPILKAGLKKLIDASKKQLVLELTQLDPTSLKNSTVIQEFLSLPRWAQENAANLTIVSVVDGLGTAKSRADAVKDLNSPLGRLLQTEARLQAELRSLEAQKVDLAQRMSTAGAGGADIKAIRKENSTLKAITSSLEDGIKRQLKRRKDAVISPAAKSKIDATVSLLNTVLEQEGILPLKSK